MKHLVNTNLESVGSFDFNSVYTDGVKKAQLAYAYGKDGSSADAEGQYVYDKFKASVAELPDEVTVLPRYDIEEYLKKGYNEIYVCQRCGDDRNDGTKGKPVATIERQFLF